jgi:NhaP-type Na+/H+ or K+/H+ antiporter
MMDKTPLQYEWLTYAWVVALSAWGGVASYVRKIKDGKTRFSVSELVGEVCISAFVGVVTFFICESAQFNQVIAAAFIGISGHMGSRAIFLAEKWFETRVKQKIDNNDSAT